MLFCGKMVGAVAKQTTKKAKTPDMFMKKKKHIPRATNSKDHSKMSIVNKKFTQGHTWIKERERERKKLTKETTRQLQEH